ncbi:low molecular weight protein arginine phosphatase [Alicyclobacillus kakegawensis]|uniref:low molecular weight protein arginine phosphatase n=1 Tax=Alicyclobacillus kakegawensis TaxID=392012 RepID=UPI00082FEF2F|nr:low molecular weight protein arginine phosphatase [Alicyclobacillus kakegawensis]
MRIVFVCTGNTCRSPMAARLLQQAARQRGLDWEIESAGLYAMAGSPMTEQAAQALRRRGVADTAHRAQVVDAELVARADLVLAMTSQHAAELKRRFPEASQKIHELAKFAGHSSADVADPFGGDEAAYDRCAQEIERHLRDVLEKLAPGREPVSADSEETGHEDCDCQ